MNLRELEYLVAVDEERHFHRAAERCFVSQPTLSGQIKKLEQELGAMLIERTSRQVNMTEVGRAVADQARRVLNEVRGIRDIVQSYEDPMVGDVQMGLIPTIGPYLLPYIMAPLRQHYPGLRLWLHEYQTHVLLEKLHKAEMDVLILALPADTGGLATSDLYREPFQLALPRDNPLLARSEVTLADIANEELMLLEQGHCLRDHVLDVCLLAGARENAGFHASSLETLRHMVGEGMGITLIPELAVPARKPRREPVQYLPFSDPKPNRRIAMVYRKGSYREPVFESLAEVIRQSLPVTIFF